MAPTLRLVALSAAAALCAAAAQVSGSVPSGPWPTTEPFYPHYPSRNVTVMTGAWATGSYGGDVAAATYADLAAGTPNQTSVPSCFDIAPAAIKGPRGTVFYRAAHACTPGARALVRFYAVNFFARVFFDGVEQANHTAGPYTPFARVAPPCGAGGSREVSLMVNNEFNKTLSPTATGGDFYFYGGVIRPVVVTELPGAAYWLDHVEAPTADVAAGLINVRVVLGGNAPAQVELFLAFNGGAPGAQRVAPVVQGVATLAGVAVPAGTKPWALGQGNLFTLTVADAHTGDALTVRSGLRVLGTAPGAGGGARLTINGEVVKLKGYNRHVMWPDTGAAVTPAQEAIDLATVKGVNANYIRGGHYPQSQSWLDLLDENGIAQWEEALGPGVSTADIQSSVFMSAQVEAVTSMVTTSANHPSVIFHGFFNEGPSSDTKACPGYQTLADTVHALSSTSWRMVTWASDKTTGDVCMAAADVVSYNSYPGWYDHPGNGERARSVLA